MDEEEIELSVLFGKEQLTVRMQTSSEIVCLKRRLEEQTGVFVRLQKIICRGKVSLATPAHVLSEVTV